MKRDLLSVEDVKDDLLEILELARNIKNRQEAGEEYEPLRDKSLAMIFEKPSTRTRVSFEVAMTQLGGHALYINTMDLQLGRGETIADTAKVLSRYVDAITYRAYSHENMEELARNATVPVINALDSLEHPCQIIADLFTIREVKGELPGLKLAYVGDGNNVCNSLLLGSALSGLRMVAACPVGYEPDPTILRRAKVLAEEKGGSISIVRNPEEAVKGADIVYTDVWVSMGDEDEGDVRKKVFRNYQVNDRLMSLAKEDGIFMHCLPAHRGMEVTGAVIDSERSIVFDQAENRLHAQKAVLVKLLS